MLMPGGKVRAASGGETRPAGPPDREAVTRQLERILASGDFDASPRSRAFITYIVEETLAGRQEALTQAAIATTVFGRREDFDPTVDPIVRIQAGRLRRSLERYYLLEGASDPLRIELPRGSYVPVARWVSPAETEPPQEKTAAPPSAAVWPAVVVGSFEVDAQGGGLNGAPSQFKETLCLELGRYGDVSVVLQPSIDPLGSPPCERGHFALSGQIESDTAGHAVKLRLVECNSSTQVWAESFHAPDPPAGDFLVQTARVVAAAIASEQGVVARRLWAALRHDEAALATAYGAILRSYHFFLARKREDFAPSVAALQEAVAREPECGLAWVQLSRLYLANYNFEIDPLETPIDAALAYAQTAVRLDAASRRARTALAGALLHKGELASAREQAIKALELHADSFVYEEWIGYVLTLAGDWERGPALLKRAIARNPHHLPAPLFALWVDHLRRGELQEACDATLQYFDQTFYWRAVMRATCLGLLGRIAEAREEAATVRRLRPAFEDRGRTLIGRLVKFPELVDRIVDGLDQAGLTLA